MSTPSVFEFSPKEIAWQERAITDIRCNFDYGDVKTRTLHEIMLSGSVGSAKTLFMAHLIVTHCLFYSRSRALIGRLSMPDLKSTILQKILDHLEDERLINGRDYTYNISTSMIKFRNGSEIISRSWHDKNFKSKFRSLELSCAAIEELTENDGEYWDFYSELRMRLQRLPQIPECFIICATNPDSPSHPAYDYFIRGSEKYKTRHVYYSLTTDNPYLPKSYVDQLLQDLDPLTAQRMIFGKWIYINSNIIYHQYDAARHLSQDDYKINLGHEIRISFDFNIGQGKPMSCTIAQFIKGHFHFFDESVIEGADTEEILKDLANRGLLDHETIYRIHGDATGKSRSAASKRSNYDVISQFLDQYRTKKGDKISYSIDVPTVNPPIRERHNLFNGYLNNTRNEKRITVYKNAKVLDEGLRKTKLKKGGNYIEDDSSAYQHITTAAGYLIYYCHKYCRENDQAIQFY